MFHIVYIKKRCSQIESQLIVEIEDGRTPVLYNKTKVLSLKDNRKSPITCSYLKLIFKELQKVRNIFKYFT